MATGKKTAKNKTKTGVFLFNGRRYSDRSIATKYILANSFGINIPGMHGKETLRKPLDIEKCIEAFKFVRKHIKTTNKGGNPMYHMSTIIRMSTLLGEHISRGQILKLIETYHPEVGGRYEIKRNFEIALKRMIDGEMSIGNKTILINDEKGIEKAKKLAKKLGISMHNVIDPHKTDPFHMCLDLE